MFDRTHPDPEYQISEYATSNRRWKRAPTGHPIEIMELLNYEAQRKHHQNEILGDKVAQILKQNTNLSDKIAKEYLTPSRMARSPRSSATTKAETTTKWFLRKLATSPFPIQTIRTLEKGLQILTNTVQKNK
jgi:hypothetical protein